MQKTVSIIVPVYNVEAYLHDCIQSLINQTYTALQIILIDDGSTDHSPQICDEYAAIDTRILVHHIKNSGVSHARNVGLHSASGDYIFFIDADDCCEKESIESLVKHHNGNQDSIAVLCCDRIAAEYHFIRSSSSAATPTVPVKTNLYSGLGLSCYMQARSVNWSCWGILFPKSLILENSIWFDENMGNLEDSAFMSAVTCFVNNVVQIERPLYHYRMNPTSITSRCIDRKWQATGWVNSRKATLQYFAHVYSPKFKKHLKLVNRYCMRNFHAECFAGRISYSQACRLMNHVVFSSAGNIDPFIKRLMHYKLTFPTFLLYRTLFSLYHRVKHK